MLQAMEEIEAGTVWFNDPLTDNEAAPFGGMKASGNGSELGTEGLDDFRQTKHVHIDTKMDSEVLVVSVLAITLPTKPSTEPHRVREDVRRSS